MALPQFSRYRTSLHVGGYRLFGKAPLELRKQTIRLEEKSLSLEQPHPIQPCSGRADFERGHKSTDIRGRKIEGLQSFQRYATLFARALSPRLRCGNRRDRFSCLRLW
jgi:hypothetical protein